MTALVLSLAMAGQCPGGPGVYCPAPTPTLPSKVIVVPQSGSYYTAAGAIVDWRRQSDGSTAWVYRPQPTPAPAPAPATKPKPTPEPGPTPDPKAPPADAPSSSGTAADARSSSLLRIANGVDMSKLPAIQEPFSTNATPAELLRDPNLRFLATDPNATRSRSTPRAAGWGPLNPQVEVSIDLTTPIILAACVLFSGLTLVLAIFILRRPRP